MKPCYTMEWLVNSYEAGDSLKFLYFWGHTPKHNEATGKHIFSQWFGSPFIVDSVTYNTAEHWMMAQKARLFGDQYNFDKIISSKSPGEAKELGRQVSGYDDLIWNKKKFEIVKTGNIHKFNQHPALAEYLLQTENRVLVEASPVDKVWGIGLSQDSEDIGNIYAWPGQNLLGFAIMEARDFLKTTGHFSYAEHAISPPWVQFPDKDAMDMFWKMGAGEDYIISFSRIYNPLSEQEKQVYRLIHPQPPGWDDFYE